MRWGRVINLLFLVLSAGYCVRYLLIVIRTNPPAWFYIPYIVFELMQIALLIRYSPPVASAKGLLETGIPVIVAILPVLIATVFPPSPVSRLSQIIGGTVVVLSYFLAIWAMTALRTCFSVLPEARRVVRRGPYRWIRHPIYTSYLIWCLGAAIQCYRSYDYISALGVWSVLLVWRAQMEERKLAATFPEYQDYCRTTSRFFPGLF